MRLRARAHRRRARDSRGFALGGRIPCFLQPRISPSRIHDRRCRSAGGGSPGGARHRNAEGAPTAPGIPRRPPCRQLRRRPLRWRDTVESAGVAERRRCRAGKLRHADGHWLRWTLGALVDDPVETEWLQQERPHGYRERGASEVLDEHRASSQRCCTIAPAGGRRPRCCAIRTTLLESAASTLGSSSASRPRSTRRTASAATKLFVML